jgi:hypothetical protein
MSSGRPLDLALGVLDHQLLDVEERRCGKIDDLELERNAAGELHVAAILVGAPAWRGDAWAVSPPDLEAGVRRAFRGPR